MHAPTRTNRMTVFSKPSKIEVTRKLPQKIKNQIYNETKIERCNDLIQKICRNKKRWEAHISARAEPKIVNSAHKEFISDEKIDSVVNDLLNLSEQELRKEVDIKINPELAHIHDKFKIGKILFLCRKYNIGTQEDRDQFRDIIENGATLRGNNYHFSSWPRKPFDQTKHDFRYGKIPEHTPPRIIPKPPHPVPTKSAWPDSPPTIVGDSIETQKLREQYELALKTTEVTKEEVDKGWLSQPIPWASRPTGITTFCRRFAIRQPSKIRQIDDCRPLNKHVKICHRLPLPTVGDFVSLIFETSHGIPLQMTQKSRTRRSTRLRQTDTTNRTVLGNIEFNKVDLLSFDIEAAYK